ncbi:CG0192-related protein [Pseudonocardia sp. CA-142604]|uniref:CG0192-related protein n=1 Tax=Pseudonocardia sp. CA-142604 TaxID=3240024 RepID=UPI003D8EAA66
MALIHRAQLSPTKHQLIAKWLPTRSWSKDSVASQVELVGAYRFDDPSGAVGIETHVVRTGDVQVLQVPLTYRDAPLARADDFLVGTTEHSVLGRRWVYDGCGDPAYAAALATVILSGGREAQEWVEQADGRSKRREPSIRVVGSGSPGVGAVSVDSVSAMDDGTTTTVSAPGLELVVRRVLGGPTQADDDLENLTGTWPGSAEPTPLAYARRVPS